MTIGTTPSPRYECRISSSPFDISKTNYKHQQVWFLLVGMNWVFLVQFWFPHVVLPWKYLTRYIYIFLSRWDSDQAILRSTKRRRVETWGYLDGNILKWLLQICNVFASNEDLNTSSSTNDYMRVWCAGPNTVKTKPLVTTSIVWKVPLIYTRIDKFQDIDWLIWMNSPHDQSLFPDLAFRVITAKTAYMVAINWYHTKHLFHDKLTYGGRPFLSVCLLLLHFVCLHIRYSIIYVVTRYAFLWVLQGMTSHALPVLNCVVLRCCSCLNTSRKV